MKGRKEEEGEKNVLKGNIFKCLGLRSVQLQHSIPALFLCVRVCHTISASRMNWREKKEKRTTPNLERQHISAMGKWRNAEECRFIWKY